MWAAILFCAVALVGAQQPMPCGEHFGLGSLKCGIIIIIIPTGADRVYSHEMVMSSRRKIPAVFLSLF